VIYSAALAAFVLRPRAATIYVAVPVTAVLLASLILAPPVRYWFAGTTGLLVVMIGRGDSFSAEHLRHALCRRGHPPQLPRLR
jgi:hypothetical protein